MDRNSLIVGPALCTHGAAQWFSKDDVTVSLDQDTFNVETAAHGKIDERAIDIKAEASMTPAGQWNAAFRAAVWNRYANMVIGTSIFGATDTPLVIKAPDTAGGTHTLICAAVTKLPDIILSATKTMIGSLGFTGIRGLSGTAWNVDNAVYTVTASDGSIVDATFDAEDIVTQPYFGNFGAVAGLNGAFETEDGWTISFDLQTEARQVDSLGTIDYKFKSISVMAKCVPIGPTAAQLLSAAKIQGGTARRGQSFYGIGNTLYIGSSYADPTSGYTLYVPKAHLKSEGFRFGATVLRNGEVGFVAARGFSSGAQQALFTVA